VSEEEHKDRLLLHMTVEALGSPGLVVNPDIAGKAPCKCYTYMGQPKICFTRGIIGTLSTPQREAYCKEVVKMGESKRIGEWMEAKEEAKREYYAIPEPRRKIEDWLHAMGKALRKHGIEL